MRNVPTLTWRELNAYFFSPLAYIVLTVFLALSGIVFYTAVKSTGMADLRGWIFTTAFVMLPASAIIAMRLLAEESRTGTLEMLMTAAVTDTEVALSKFLGALLFYLFMLAPSLVYVAILLRLGDPDPGPIITGYISLILLGSLLLSVGLFCSSLTRNQIIAAILALIAVFALWMLPMVGYWASGWMSNALVYVGMTSHLEGFARGQVDLRDVGYFVTGTAFFLFLSVKVLESRKWR